MADNFRNRGEPDRSRINLSEEQDVRYWTQSLGVSREKLEQTIKLVGNAADTVKWALSTEG